jgi:tripartite-type tricarboxylate transporter receptor subunit TctC
MNTTRACRAGLCTIFAAMLAVGAFTSAAQAFPDKPITLIVPWPAGGGSDISMRLVADAASKKFGQPVVVVNRPGAGGAVGMREIASATADGYTVGMGATGLVARQYTNPQANLMTDVEPVAFFGSDASALSVRSDLGINTLAEFVKYAKANPRKIRNGNDPPGGTSYIAVAVIENALGIRLTRVPYQGYAPTVAAILAGEVQSTTVPLPDIFDHHKAGRVKILGLTADQRHFLARDIPTFREQGFDVIVGTWRALVAPKGVPEDRMRVLEAKFMEALRDPDFVKRANKAGFNIGTMGRKETGDFIRNFDKALYPILLDAGLVKARRKP